MMGGGGWQGVVKYHTLIFFWTLPLDVSENWLGTNSEYNYVLEMKKWMAM